jgi:glycosyltransferase involved in cell wall biosynthesis
MQADRVLCLNPADVPCLLPLLLDRGRLVTLPPFLNAAEYRAIDREAGRAALAVRFGLAPDVPWLIAVAMMRPGDKLRSYEMLGAALAGLMDRDWRLVVVGDGKARPEVEAALAPLGPRVAWAGGADPDGLPQLYAAADLCVWPAINEAYGMVLLEAQAAGLPVVAGASGGVAAIVAGGRTGLLTPPGDAAAFAASVARLLDDADLRAAMGAAARNWVARRHDIEAASDLLDSALRGAAAERRAAVA